MKNIKYPISFVVPVYKSEKTIDKVINEIDKVKFFDWEAILVNDNSPDNVREIIKRITKKFPRKIVSIELTKNSGQHAAIINGFNFATKKYVATIDDDGQNPPQEILKLMHYLIKNDLDIVYGNIKHRKHNIARSLISSINVFISKYTIGNKKRIPISNVRLMRNYLAENISQASSQDNYIEGLVFLLTDRVGCLPIQHQERLAGKSSYNTIKLIKLLSNHLIGNTGIILKVISIFSLITSLVAFLIGATYFFLTINNNNRPSGWLSTYLTIALLFGLLFLILSILTEYINRIYTKLNQTNVKIVKRIYP